MRTDIDSIDAFCNRWLEKAREYDTQSLADSFDKFAALYVVYNRVYTEIGFFIRRKKAGRIANRPIPTVTQFPKKPFAPLPDKLSATRYAVEFYGRSRLQQEISSNTTCRYAVTHLVDLIKQRRFYFHEDYDTGLPDYQKDLRLAETAELYEPEAILTLIYQARCNMFHGEKEFIASQKELLSYLSDLLSFITLKILGRLLTDLQNNLA